MRDPESMNQHNQGFTLIEILVVLALFVFIAGFALFVSMDSYRGFSFRSERDTIISVLQKARNQAISNICLGACSTNDGKKHGVRFDPANKQYIIFQTTTDYTTGHDVSVDQAISMNNTVSFTTSPPLPPPPLPFDIIFNQLDGTSAGRSFTVSDGSHPPSQISINSEGQIDNP